MIIGRLLSPKFAWMPNTKQMSKRLAENKSTQQKKWKKAREEDMECSEALACVESADGMHYLEYMNINCGYEMVMHLNIPILHACDHKNAIVYLSYLSMTMHAINYVPHWMMRRVSNALLL